MTVKELVNCLKQQPQDKAVVIDPQSPGATVITKIEHAEDVHGNLIVYIIAV